MGALTRRYWLGRWPRALLLLGLLPAAAMVWEWPWFTDEAIRVATASEGGGNTPQMIAAAKETALWHTWSVRLSVLAGLGLNLWWLSHPRFWRWAAWGPLAFWWLAWVVADASGRVMLYDFIPDRGVNAVMTFVLCLCASLGIAAFTLVTAPRPETTDTLRPGQ
ncbi:hypothetical protein ACFP81_08040 [Deinococcus lacus]|uniref:Uncharacterized protein n=1 Tax=Deinococcus lacus TaxID=392561 RepID=A0ABW1YCL4_9DEIO